MFPHVNTTGGLYGIIQQPGISPYTLKIHGVKSAKSIMFHNSCRYFRALILIAGLLLAMPVVAGDLVISRSVLEDATGTLTIADVSGREFEPAGPRLFKGYTDSVHWLRLKVRAPAKGSEVVLFIRQPYLNEVRLYEADAGDPRNWKTRVTGNHYPYSERERPKSTLGFIVDVSAPETTYYLRLKTSTVSQLSVEALTPVEAERIDNRFDMMEVFFLTAMLALLLWALYSYYLFRLPAVGLFAIHQAAYILYGVGVTGYLAPLIPDDLLALTDGAAAIFYCGVGFTTLLFCGALFKPYDPPPLMMRVLNALLLAFPVQLVAIGMGHISIAVIINLILVRVSWWYFVVMAFSLRKELSPSRRLLQVFFVAITLIFSAFWIANHTGMAIAISSLGRELLIINGLIIGCLFAMMLHARTRQLQSEAQQSSLELNLSKQKLELELNLRKQAEKQARIDHLTGLFNRRHFIELAEREISRSTRYKRPLALLMFDIDHFKAINDTWGHNVGDAVLQKIALLISNSLRDVDILGRTGGEEFAVILPESDAIEAACVAQRLCATISDAQFDLPDMQVTISIGLAELNGRELSLDGLLNEADQAMYSAKRLGRNRVVVFE